MTDDDGFISMPPGWVDTDSGTHKRERVERPVRPKPDDIVFVTAAPGAPAAPAEPAPPAPAPPAEPAPAAPVPPAEPPHTPAPEPAPALDEPVVESQPTAPIPRGFRLQIPGLPEPRLVGEGAPLFIGRAPAADPGHPNAHLLAVPDPGKSMSKTHAMLVVDDGVLRVHDLHSTNGVWVVPADGEAIEVEPGTPVPVPPGAELELGDVVIRVEHG